MREMPEPDFGLFSIDRTGRRARFAGQRLTLAPRGFDILAALLGRAGEPIEAAALMSAVEPGGGLDDAQLCDAVVDLNQALAACGAAAGYVVHHPGGAYALIVPPASTAEPRRTWSSRRTTSVLGRAACIERIAAQLPVTRFATIVGPGGMGKTTLALAVADARCAAYADGVHFVDLGPLAESRLLAQAVFAAFGPTTALGSVDAPAYLHDRHALIILDSCEHLVDAVAILVEAVLAAAPRIHVLATSREPLRAQGEWLHRLAPMLLPTRTDGLSAVAALAYQASNSSSNARGQACASSA